MAKGSQINIRLEEDDEAELEAAAKKFGLSKSGLLRHLAEQFVAEVKKTGSMSIDPKWLRDDAKADARSEWGERKHLKVAEDEKPPTPPARKAVKYPKGKKK